MAARPWFCTETCGFFQGDSRSAGQKFERLGKADPFVFLNKSEHVAVFTTGPASIALPVRIDDEGGTAIVVEGTQTLERVPRRAQFEIAFDHLDDVVGFFDLLDPIVCQGPPVPEPAMKSARAGDSGSSPVPCPDLKPSHSPRQGVLAAGSTAWRMEEKGKRTHGHSRVEGLSTGSPPLRPFLPRSVPPQPAGRLAWPCPAFLCRRARHDRHPVNRFGSLLPVCRARANPNTSPSKPCSPSARWNYSRVAKTRQAGQGPPSIPFSRFISLIRFQLITPLSPPLIRRDQFPAPAQRAQAPMLVCPAQSSRLRLSRRTGCVSCRVKASPGSLRSRFAGP